MAHQWLTPSIHKMKSSVSKNILLGLLYGCIGIILMNFHIPLTSTLWVDLRHIPVLVAALYGGSIPAVLSALIIGFVRILWFDASLSSWLAFLNLLLTAGLCIWICMQAWSRRVKGIMMIGGIYLPLSGLSLLLYPIPFYYYRALLLYGIFLAIGGLSILSLLEFLQASKDSMEKWKISDLELKETVKELQSTKDQLESFITHSGDAIAITNIHAHVIKVNLAFEKIFGWTEEEILGKPIPRIPPEEPNRLYDVIEKVVVQGEKVIAMEVNALTKSGKRMDAGHSPFRPSETSRGKRLGFPRFPGMLPNVRKWKGS